MEAREERPGDTDMLKTIMRAVLGIQGALALFVAANAYLKPEMLSQQLGLTMNGELGLSTFRGDIGSLFAGAGLFMLAAAIRGNRLYLAPPLLMTSIALAARTATAFQVGFLPEFVQPMTVEGVTVLVLLLGYATLGRD